MPILCHQQSRYEPVWRSGLLGPHQGQQLILRRAGRPGTSRLSHNNNRSHRRKSQPRWHLSADSFGRLRIGAVLRKNQQRGPFRRTSRTLRENLHPTGPGRGEGILEIFVPSRVAEGQNFRNPLPPARFEKSLPSGFSTNKKTSAIPCLFRDSRNRRGQDKEVIPCQPVKLPSQRD